MSKLRLQPTRFHCALLTLALFNFHFFFSEFSLLDILWFQDDSLLDPPADFDELILEKANAPPQSTLQKFDFTRTKIFVNSSNTIDYQPREALTSFIEHKDRMCRESNEDSFIEESAIYCQVKCLLRGLKFAQYAEGHCLCLQTCELTTVTKNGKVVYEYSSPKYPLAVKIFEDKRCDPGTWIDLKCARSAYDCMVNVLQNAECSNSWFAHAGIGDGNCYCVHKGTDCSIGKLTKHIAVSTYLILGLESILKIQSKKVACKNSIQVGSQSILRSCLDEVLTNSKCTRKHLIFDPGDCRCFTEDVNCPNTGSSTLYSFQIERAVGKKLLKPRFCMMDTLDEISDSGWLQRLQNEWNERQSLSQFLHFELDEGYDEMNRHKRDKILSDCPQFPLQSEKTDWTCLYNIHSLNGIFQMDTPVEKMRSLFLSTDQSGFAWPLNSKYGNKDPWKGSIRDGFTSDVFCAPACADVVYEGCQCLKDSECFPTGDNSFGCFVAEENTCLKTDNSRDRLVSNQPCRSSCRYISGPAPCYLATLLEWMHEYNVSQAVPRTLILGIEDHPWLSQVANQDERCETKRECNHLNEDFCAETFKWWHSWFDRIFYGAKDIDIPHIHAYPMGLTYSYIIGRSQQFYEAIRDARLDGKEGILASWGSLVAIHGPESRTLGAFVKSVDYITFNTHIKPEDYFQELSKYRFLVAPRGNGIWSPKFLEAILVLTIPITLGYQTFVDLKNYGYPIVTVESWEEITKENLDIWWKEISPTLPQKRWAVGTVDGMESLLYGTCY